MTTIELLIDLMKIDSTTGSEGSLAAKVAEVLEAAGWIVVQQSLPDQPERLNILATRKPISGKFSPRVIFNTHLDTVPPYIPPTQDSKNVYGRGSNDAKGQIACMIGAANTLVKENPTIGEDVGLLFVVGEEVDHVGMKAANALEYLNPEYLIVGEPTELKFATIQKGALKYLEIGLEDKMLISGDVDNNISEVIINVNFNKVLLKSEGVAGHSGYPASGTSAIHKLLPVLNDIMNHSWPDDPRVGATTFNIGLIRGGQAQNAWAAHAEANIFFRVTTSVDDIWQQLQSIVNGRVTMENINSNDPALLSDTPFEAEMDQVAFNTDLPFYDGLDKLKGKFLFGAGSIKNAHSASEFMPKDELEKCENTLIRLVTELLK